MTYYKDGAYLLRLPGESDGQVCVIKNTHDSNAYGEHAIVVTVGGSIRVLSNLPEGYTLYRLIPFDQGRIDALELMEEILEAYNDIGLSGSEQMDARTALEHLRSILHELGSNPYE